VSSFTAPASSALDLRAGQPREFRRIESANDLRPAQLWLTMLTPRSDLPKAPDLVTLQQLPVTPLYRDHLRGPVHVTVGFWCEWVRMIADKDVRESYLYYVLEMGDLWRFAAGGTRSARPRSRGPRSCGWPRIGLSSAARSC